MWGESIAAHKSFNMILYPGDEQIEDITPDEGYRLYSLKNLSVVIKKDVGYLPLKRFFSYYEKSGSSLFEAYRTFSIVRNWVKINRYRFKYSAPEITSNWDTK